MDTKEYYGFSDTIKPCLQGGACDSKTIIEHNENLIFAITLNLLPDKRVALPIPGQKSVSQQFCKYSLPQQRIILKKILFPFEGFRIDDLKEEKTDRGNVHYHTTLSVPDASYMNVRSFVDDINKRYTNAKKAYVPLDFKILIFEHDKTKWQKYIHKEDNKI